MFKNMNKKRIAAKLNNICILINEYHKNKNDVLIDKIIKYYYKIK